MPEAKKLEALRLFELGASFRAVWGLRASKP